jgi:hypothetical protein
VKRHSEPYISYIGTSVKIKQKECVDINKYVDITVNIFPFPIPKCIHFLFIFKKKAYIRLRLHLR